jgi:hypothetical protein
MSGAATVGRLVVTVSGDVEQLKVDMREAQAITGSVTKEIVNGMQGITDATYARNDAGKRMIAQLQEELRTFGMSADELKIYKASLLGVGDEAARLIERTNAMKAAQASFTQELASSGAALKAHGTGAAEAGAHVEEFGFHTASAKRELLVLAHELSQGNFKKFGGSMLVLGEQTGAAGLLFSAAGIAAIAMGAAIVGVGVALVHGAEQQKAMNDALILTGNYAGATSDSLNALAHAAVTSGGSIGEAKKAVTELAASGKFTSDQIGSISQAVVALEHATGASIEETIKQFESLAVQAGGHSARASTEISQATVKLDEKYHFLTLAVYDQITALEKEGDLKGASKVATEEFARVTKERAEQIVDNLGNVARAWNLVKQGIGGAVDAVGNWGKRSTEATIVADLQADLDRLYANKSRLLSSGGHVGSNGDLEYDRKIAADISALANAQQALNHANEIAATQAANTMAQSNAVEAAKRIDAMLLRAQSKEQGALNAALAEYHAELDKIRAGATTEDGDPRLSEKAVKAGEEALKRLHSMAVKGNDDRSARLQDALLLEQTALEREKGIYEARGKMIELYHKSFGTSDNDFFSAREAARGEYIASEAIAFANEKSLIDASIAKTPEEIAAKKQKYDAIVKLHLKFVDDMRNAGGEDQAKFEADLEKQYQDNAKAIASAGDAEIKSLDAAIAKQREHNAEIGKTPEQIERAKQAQVDAATAVLQAEDDAFRAALANADLDDILVGKERLLYEQRLTYLDRIIAKRREDAELLASGAVLEANAKAADDASKAWAKASKTIETDLTNAILDGGGRGWKKLVRDMEFAFARMVLQPILAPISGGIASFLNPGAPQAQGGPSGLIGAASSASSLYSMISGGTATIGKGVSYLGNAVGSNSTFSFGQGLQGFSAGGEGSGISASAANAGSSIASSIPLIAATVASYFGARAIAGQYRVEGIGAALNYLGLAGGVVNRAFGIGDKTVSSAGISGAIGPNGVTGQNFSNWTQKGGWFRSDKSGTETSALSGDIVAQLASGFDALKKASLGLSTVLGTSADALDDYSKQFNITLTNDEAANQKAIAEFFSTMGDEMATKLIPNLSDFANASETASATLQRISSDYTNLDSALSALGLTFGSVGLDSIKARERLIDLSGGIQSLGQKITTYEQAFYSDSEKIAPVLSSVKAAMASLNLAGIATKEQFKQVVDGLDKTTEAGAKEFASLLDLAPAFAQAADYTEQLQKATEDKASADQAAANAIAQAQASAKATQQAFVVNLGDALANAMTNATAAAKALRDFNASLKLGNLSTLSKDAQYALAKQQYGSADEAGKQAAATALLQASQARNGSAFEYARDFAMVSNDLSKLADQKDAYAAAIPDFFRAIQAMQMDGSHANGLGYVPFNGYKAKLHEGEGVLTADENRTYRNGGASLNVEIRQMRSELGTAMRRIADHTRTTADMLVRVTKNGNSLQTTVSS